MGSGGGGGGGSDRNRGVERGRTAPPTPKPKPAPKPKPSVSRPAGGEDRPAPKPAPKTGAKLGDTGGPASEKMREVGVSYTPTSKPGGGLEMKADIKKTAPSGELARTLGPSPGDVLATVGDLPSVDRDTAAANIAGRPDLNRDVLGDLATRARVGQLPDTSVGSVNLLNAIGAKSAMNILTKIAKDEPVIKDGKITYSTEIVKDERGGVAGIIEPGLVEGSKVYTGRPDLDPFKGEPERDEPEPQPQPDEPVIEDEAAGTLLAPTKKRARATRSKRFAGETLLEGGGVLYK